ncbi:MAG: hypothetical protein CYG61_10780 [Actinobacteria bacterium]|nr:MAG: hypothetical protein CYG61_10780 [Actinomycetota bacterium]
MGYSTLMGLLTTVILLALMFGVGGVLKGLACAKKAVDAEVSGGTGRRSPCRGPRRTPLPAPSLSG